MARPLDGYTCESGGAQGADIKWKSVGKEYGVVTVDWRPIDLDSMTKEGREQMLDDVANAAKVLKRPYHIKGELLIKRNWFIAHHAASIYAIGTIVNPGEEDFKGFENKTGKQVLAGGTAWAVEMAIQKGKKVFVFNMRNDRWLYWNSLDNMFTETEIIPVLSKSFGGIGSRTLTSAGGKAIEDIYQKTIDYENSIKIQGLL